MVTHELASAPARTIPTQLEVLRTIRTLESINKLHMLSHETIQFLFAHPLTDKDKLVAEAVGEVIQKVIDAFGAEIARIVENGSE